jgi:hypothetical protein
VVRFFTFLKSVVPYTKNISNKIDPAKPFQKKMLFSRKNPLNSIKLYFKDTEEEFSIFQQDL